MKERIRRRAECHHREAFYCWQSSTVVRFVYCVVSLSGIIGVRLSHKTAAAAPEACKWKSCGLQCDNDKVDHLRNRAAAAAVSTQI